MTLLAFSFEPPLLTFSFVFFGHDSADSSMFFGSSGLTLMFVANPDRLGRERPAFPSSSVRPNRQSVPAEILTRLHESSRLSPYNRRDATEKIFNRKAENSLRLSAFPFAVKAGQFLLKAFVCRYLSQFSRMTGRRGSA
jgi:hypothetical protein